MPSIVAIGIGLVDVYPQKKQQYPGGNEYNISCYAAELGARSSFMGVFAPDATGRLLEDLLVERGIDVSHSRHADGYSSIALVELRDGNRVFTDWTRAAVTDRNPIQFNEDDFAYIRAHDVACLSYASRLRYEDFKQLYDAGIGFCYDFSDSFTDETIGQMCPITRFGFFSCDHLAEPQCVQLMERAVGLGCQVAIATRGKLGSMAFDGKTHFSQPAIDAPVVDTMGAGDSFITAFLNHWFLEKERGRAPNLAAAMGSAARFATLVIQREGAIGVGYDVDGPRLADIINTVKEERR